MSQVQVLPVWPLKNPINFGFFYFVDMKRANRQKKLNELNFWEDDWWTTSKWTFKSLLLIAAANKLMSQENLIKPKGLFPFGKRTESQILLSTKLKFSQMGSLRQTNNLKRLNRSGIKTMSQKRDPLNKTTQHSVYVPDSVNNQIIKMAEVSGMRLRIGWTMFLKKTNKHAMSDTLWT